MRSGAGLGPLHTRRMQTEIERARGQAGGMWMRGGSRRESAGHTEGDSSEQTRTAS